MEDDALKNSSRSVYAGEGILLATKHQKERVFLAAFKDILDASILEYVFDTDKFGTFTGEVERSGTALECVRRKCQWAAEKTSAPYVIASEGSFGPHPFIPGIAADTELVYFIDKKNNFHLYEQLFSLDTNYLVSKVSSYDELLRLADEVRFPSHALIIRSDRAAPGAFICKGITTHKELRNAYHEALRVNEGNAVWLETDMRAHLNPSRMNVIEQLAYQLARRLKARCPQCRLPGWGQKDRQCGLPCSSCHSPTDEIKSIIYGCVRCPHIEVTAPEHGLEYADPGRCQYCNP